MAEPRPTTAVELGTRKVAHDNLQQLSFSLRIGGRTDILTERAERPIMLLVYKADDMPLELVFGDDAPDVTEELAFGMVFRLRPNEAALIVQVGAQLAGQSRPVGGLEPQTEAAFVRAIKRRQLLLEPSCSACGPTASPLSVAEVSDVYLTVLAVVVPSILRTFDPRLINAVSMHWHDALRAVMKVFRAKDVWPMFEDHIPEITAFLAMHDSSGAFDPDEPPSHIDLIRHYSLEWALWRSRLGDESAGQRLAFVCDSCRSSGTCTEGCSADPELRNGFRRASPALATGRLPAKVPIVVVPLEPLPHANPSVDVTQTKLAVSDACEYLRVRDAASLPPAIRALVPFAAQCAAADCGDIGYFACQGPGCLAAKGAQSGKALHYCSTDCQRADWRGGHKSVCLGRT